MLNTTWASWDSKSKFASVVDGDCEGFVDTG